MNVIQTHGLTKKYGDTIAVNNVSMHVQQGEIYGFLGLNGAGKTTLIRMLLGLIKADGGDCQLFGQRPKQATAIWNDVGYLVETPRAYPNLSVIENLEVIFKLRGLSDRSLISNVIGRLQLSRYKDTKEKNLSLGNKQRLGLAKALLHQPKLLILDEPINGLDPAGIVEVRELLKELVADQGTTIFLSSHILSEMAKLTTRIGIIHNGILIKEMDSGELKNEINKKLILDTHEHAKAVQLLQENGYDPKIKDHRIELMNANAIEHPENIATLLVESDCPPKMINVFEEDMENYFLRIIREHTQ